MGQVQTDIKAKLKQLGKTMLELSRAPRIEAAGITYQQLNGYLNGHYGMPSRAFMVISGQLIEWENELTEVEGGSDAQETQG